MCIVKFTEIRFYSEKNAALLRLKSILQNFISLYITKTKIMILVMIFLEVTVPHKQRIQTKI